MLGIDDINRLESENERLKKLVKIYLDLIQDISLICGDEVLDKINKTLFSVTEV